MIEVIMLGAFVVGVFSYVLYTYIYKYQQDELMKTGERLEDHPMKSFFD